MADVKKSDFNTARRIFYDPVRKKKIVRNRKLHNHRVRPERVN